MSLMKSLSFTGIGAVLGVALFVALVQSCATVNPDYMNALDHYREALQEADSIGSVEPGSEAEKRALDGVKDLLSEFSRENIEGKVAGVYAEEVFFNDTLKTLRSAEAIEEYFLETADMLVSSEVRFTDTVRSGSDYYLRWEMTYESKKLNKGNDIDTIGMSHLRISPEGKIIVHQDFWDSTRGIFEHVPVVGGGIRIIRNRL